MKKELLIIFFRNAIHYIVILLNMDSVILPPRNELITKTPVSNRDICPSLGLVRTLILLI
ncbi:hypothetical protein LMANV2_330091 [Leptospira interrogans serovar Manilae]|uniref:Uncharacterized protein n=1 Tax=Leptospira interrogans serovar Manilae TaxID=214675 RepID=A0AAQ1NZN0_LEPIR|nr:hypothetical protein LMANV2_330091 [Leptospira interrogans serovar Manilae]